MESSGQHQSSTCIESYMQEKFKNFLDNTNFNPYALTECAPEISAVFFFIHELAFYLCVGSVPNLLLFLFCTSQELV